MEQNLDITNKLPQSLGTSLNRASTELSIVNMNGNLQNINSTSLIGKSRREKLLKINNPYKNYIY